MALPGRLTRVKDTQARSYVKQRTVVPLCTNDGRALSGDRPSDKRHRVVDMFAVYPGSQGMCVRQELELGRAYEILVHGSLQLRSHWQPKQILRGNCHSFFDACGNEFEYLRSNLAYPEGLQLTTVTDPVHVINPALLFSHKNACGYRLFGTGAIVKISFMPPHTYTVRGVLKVEISTMWVA